MNLEYLKQEKEKVMNGCGRNCGELNCGERYLSINLLFLCPSCEEKKEIYNKGIQAVENTIKETNKEKFILDVCCGSRMFWLDKQQPNTLFCDIREYNKGFIDNRPNRELHPDMIMDFRKLEFPDKSFKLVVMDPPHLIGKPDGCRMTKTYGALNKDTWQQDIKKGFDEAWRVLEDYGILVFKWNDSSVKRKELLSVLDKPYLFGHPNGSKIPTHWFVFMKIPDNQLQKQKEDTK